MFHIIVVANASESGGYIRPGKPFPRPDKEVGLALVISK